MNFRVDIEAEIAKSRAERRGADSRLVRKRNDRVLIILLHTSGRPTAGGETLVSLVEFMTPWCRTSTTEALQHLIQTGEVAKGKFSDNHIRYRLTPAGLATTDAIGRGLRMRQRVRELETELASLKVTLDELQAFDEERIAIQTADYPTAWDLVAADHDSFCPQERLTLMDRAQ